MAVPANFAGRARNLVNTRVLILVLAGCFCVSAGSAPVTGNNPDWAALRRQALAVLRAALESETGPAGIEAAEALILNNYPIDVGNLVTAGAETSPQRRVGAWRLLVRAAGNNDARRQRHLQDLVAVFENPNAPDRVEALAVLGALGYAEATPAVEAAAAGSGRLSVYAWWVLANAHRPEAEAALCKRRLTADPAAQTTAAYVLQQLPELSSETLDVLATGLTAETGLLSDTAAAGAAAFYIHAPAETWPQPRRAARTALEQVLQHGSGSAQVHACRALARSGTAADCALLQPLLTAAHPRVRCQAANALLRIERRRFRGLQGLDWVIIGLYGALMLGVGWYYSRRQTSTEEYFLAGRSMNSWLVGISIFATLLSTISYLGAPGEIVKHGPVILFGLLILPLVYAVAGYFLIPHIMRLHITSAYEILETRLGPAVRTLGAVIFILTRLVWMAFLIYLAAKLMVEMLNWRPAAIPWVIVVAGVVAVLYTAMGGLRAVVVTDLLQFIILMGGALLTLLLITLQMRGFGWFPTEWALHWDRQPLFSWNPGTRVTVVGSLLATFSWWICTAGSDQVAIQRYLATRDVAGARRSLLVSLIANVVVVITLYLVGFALLGFFTANPHLIPDGKNLIRDADFLFPQYIANCLPIGLAGLVVAAMFAAAMSSLDSGINSIVTVVSRDFFERFRRPGDRDSTDADRTLHFAKWLVVGIGVFVVLISSVIDKVPGNITEVTNKTNGLFVAPLFGLFVMAFFFRRPTAFGAVVGAVYGFLVAVIFAYWDKITGAAHSLSFQLIIAAALVTHLVVGWLLSRVTDNRELCCRGLWAVLAMLPITVVFLCLFKWGPVLAAFLERGAAH